MSNIKLNTAPYLPQQTRLTEVEKTQQFNTLINVIKLTFGEDSSRTRKLEHMYQGLMDQVKNAPASSKIYFHDAFAGGYLSHVLHVIEAAHKLLPVYLSLGGVQDFTKEEMVFAAMHHDLGKLGDEDGPAYVPTTDLRDHAQGIYYRSNSTIQVMSCFERTMYLLNQFGITYTKNELLGMKMADGVFSDEAKHLYYNNGIFPHKTHLGYLIHWADWMATITEKDVVRVQYEENLRNDTIS